jgi:hypothetical protein
MFASKLTLASQILFAYEDELGEDVIASLDFWGRGQGGS